MIACPRIVLGPRKPELGEPRDRRLPVARQHLVELDHGLGGVERDRAAALVGGPLGGSEELGRAGVDLGRGEAGADQPAVGAVEAVVEGQRPREPLAAPLLVPLPVDAPAVLREPAPRSEGQRAVDAEAEVRGALGHVLAELADLEHRGHAAPEQLGHREVDAGAAGRVVLRAVSDRQGLEETGVVELGPPGVLDERPVERGARDVRVGGDEAGREHTVARVDGLVGLAPERRPRADVHDPVPLEDDRAVPEKTMTAALEGDHVAGVDQGAARGGHERSSSPKSASCRPSGR